MATEQKIGEQDEKRWILSGDVLHPALIRVYAATEEEAIARASIGNFEIEDEQDSCLSFDFDGQIRLEEENDWRGVKTEVE